MYKPLYEVTLKSSSDDDSKISWEKGGGGMINGGLGSWGVCCSLSHIILFAGGLLIEPLTMTCPTCKDWGLDGQKFSIAIVELLWIGVDVNVDSGETLAEGVRFSSGVSELFSTSEDSTGKRVHSMLINRPLYIYIFLIIISHILYLLKNIPFLTCLGMNSSSPSSAS